MAATVDTAKVKRLLGAGVEPSIVARALNCDPSYISQLLADEEFKKEVVATKLAALQEVEDRDKKIDNLEDQILDRLKDTLHWITKPRELLQAFTVMNNAKRRGAGIGADQVPTHNIVQLQLPPIVVQTYISNAYGEVIEVGGETLVTMSSSELVGKLAEQQAGVQLRAGAETNEHAAATAKERLRQLEHTKLQLRQQERLTAATGPTAGSTANRNPKFDI